MKKTIAPILLSILLAACGGGGGGSNPISTPVTPTGPTTPVVTSAAEHCAVPRPAGTINPDTNQPYGDVQGTLTDEMAWIQSFVNTTYLWYADVPTVSSTPYKIGATVPYVNPRDNSASTETLTSNYDVVDAYFNSQRSPLSTASGKPKDQFHFTYVTTDWQNLSSSGGVTGFGFQAFALNTTPPLQATVAYTSPNTPAYANGIVRGTQFISINGIDVATASSKADLDALNTALYSPVAGTAYTFVVQIPGQPSQTTITMTAPTSITLTPVMNVGALPAPNSSVGYIFYTDQIATAEGELYNAIKALQTANNGGPVTDLVLDLRYNGGGLLQLASELSYMIAGPANTNGKIFEKDTFNNKNPFGFTTADATFSFQNTSLGLTTIPSSAMLAAGTPLPTLNLNTVYVITTGNTCSASEAIMNGLIGAGVKVVQIGETTCGKPYGFFPQDNCSTTYFTIQFEGVNNVGFGAYADGFIPGGTGTAANNLPGCTATDDVNHQLGDPAEDSLATALYYRQNGACPATPFASAKGSIGNQKLHRSVARENRILPSAAARSKTDLLW